MVLADPKSMPVNTVNLQGVLRSRPDTTVINLRQPQDLPGAINMPFVHADIPSPFSDAKLLEALWKTPEGSFKNPGSEIQSVLQDRRVLLTCYDGDSARVATNILLAKSYEADSFRGGYQALNKMRHNSSQVAINGIQESSPWVELGQEAVSVGPSQSAPVSL